ncbi:energy-coupling factor transporter transmembrane component T family protein [Corynebacterium suicordis]|uniref:Energy-coupling factor transporter transmembrane protein EcfT n=1 Tax=Corynebacterium suicordis DSM 45110 TaxID=1121369 RepID=A0ABR9ZJ87_9CORY|nr:energy-coupling factor transporter transmembrane protein EcfT [Corynebacterium suicordis]MBF4553455.1 energy-coupling factor transporter transmembrane protein EcfT [Corynebacterium suicordis DSM 45110]MDR6277571.1 biotin transport system permease protein [Corynebacterium suicordis]
MFPSSRTTQQVPRSTYIPVDSAIHRLPAGRKSVVLIALLLGSAIFLNSIPWAAGMLAIALGLYVIARIPLRDAIANLRTPLPVLLILSILLWWSQGMHEAVLRFLLIYSAVALAILFTLTTRISDMMDAMERALTPLARFGFPVESVTLACSLTMRLIPLQLETINQILDARKARGSGGSIVAFGVPLIIRTLLRAKAVGDALMSRGVGD